jgi:hypothetical protein
VTTNIPEASRPGLHNLTRRQLAGTLTGLLLTLLLAALDQTIVGTAMPRIIAQLNGFDRLPMGYHGLLAHVHDRSSDLR